MHGLTSSDTIHFLQLQVITLHNSPMHKFKLHELTMILFSYIQ